MHNTISSAFMMLHTEMSKSTWHTGFPLTYTSLAVFKTTVKDPSFFYNILRKSFYDQVYLIDPFIKFQNAYRVYCQKHD